MKVWGEMLDVVAEASSSLNMPAVSVLAPEVIRSGSNSYNFINTSETNKDLVLAVWVQCGPVV